MIILHAIIVMFKTFLAGRARVPGDGLLASDGYAHINPASGILCMIGNTPANAHAAPQYAHLTATLIPLPAAAEIAVREVRAFLEREDLPEKVFLVCFNSDIYWEYEKVVSKK